MTEKPAVLITGCSTGIGRATAERLTASGDWTVYATARDPETLRDLGAAGARVRRLDTTDDESMRAVVDEAGDSLFGLVNNAGYGEYGVVEELPVEALRRGFETNVVGTVRLCQLALPRMRAAGAGRIVIVGSVGGLFTFPAAAGYHLTKYALESLADALRYEVAPFGVGVTLIQPGLVRTEFGATALRTLAANGAADGPYTEVKSQVETMYRRAFTDPAAGVGPETVAEAIEGALTGERAPSRDLVAAEGPYFVNLRRELGDDGFDGALRTMLANEPRE
ncbi:short-chain dehydrogenase/reductase [Longispora fulva]|uniref:NAD(P)-dependent dehydrogenase (Short-subunit alcohol dehydrogenase family) n=1 Tax=Longispora fulva TaxID=619741 RepID=A0A8J7GT33_9ACTN|nr:SDR family oxidoreductase [Longispora fulva]MBG6137848.1 NAD(P)-dependent dehydrogenase (short-subunit alcohol dehydrogenase family) [Longispora fulva]GIG60102.1 short-chain dehydrogenase/reductase [Longispora fulva]